MATVNLPQLQIFQQKLFNHCLNPEVKFITLLGSRQTGKSFFNKFISVFWALQEKNIRIGWVCPTNKLCKLFFNELVKSTESLIKKTNKSELVIEFLTGSNIQFFSAESGDSIRGFQFDYLIIDEAAYMKSNFWDLVLRATVLIKGRKVILCSTPNAKNGFFFQHYEFGRDESKKLYESVSINIYDNPFVSQEEIEAIRLSVPNKVFRQEYLAEFLDGEGAVFSNYRNCINDSPRKTEKYFAAIDWAKENDYTVLTIINDLKEVCCIYRINKVDYTVQVKLIAAELKKWKISEVISEENNIGTVVNELLKKEYKGRIRCITLTNQLKKEIIENLIVGFETGKISIPNNKDLLNELGYFTCTYNRETQSIKYSAKNGLHDDTVISLAYAYWLTTNYKTIDIR